MKDSAIYNQIKNEMEESLKEFYDSIGVYEIGSHAYGDFISNWSDIDFVVISNNSSDNIGQIIGNLTKNINSNFKNKIAIGGDNIIDIIYVPLSIFEDYKEIDIIDSYSAVMLRSIYEVYYYGIYVGGVMHCDVIKQVVNTIDKNVFKLSFYQPVYMTCKSIKTKIESNFFKYYYAGLFDGKDRSVIKLYLSVYRAYVLMQYNEYIYKNSIIMNSYNIPSYISKLIIYAQKLRTLWNGLDSNKTKVLIEKLPLLIEWFFSYPVNGVEFLLYEDIIKLPPLTINRTLMKAEVIRIIKNKSLVAEMLYSYGDKDIELKYIEIYTDDGNILKKSVRNLIFLVNKRISDKNICSCRVKWKIISSIEKNRVKYNE